MATLYRTIITALAALLLAPAAVNAQDHELPRVAVDGGEMDYAEYGNPNGEPVILVQGTFVADAFWPLAMTEELSDYRLILVHLRGYAGSSKVEAPFGIAEYARDVVMLMDALSIPSAHWVGHSYGGGIALQAAIESPQRLKTLTLIEPAGAPIELIEQFEPPRPPPGPDNRFDETAFTPEQIRTFQEQRIDRLFGGRETLEAIPGAYEQYFADSLTFIEVQQRTPRWIFDPERHLPAVPQPILFIHFEGGFAAHAPFADMFAEHHRDTEVVRLEGTHHSFHVEQPQPTAEVIAQFIAGHRNTGFEMPEEHFATINGVEIAYRVKGEGEPVLLIPNVIADSFVMMMNEPVLDTYQLIQFHFPGQGHSGDLVEPRTPWTLAELAAGLLDHLGIETAHAVGHSGGGTIAIRLAMLRPELVQSLILLEAGTQSYEDFDFQNAVMEHRDEFSPPGAHRLLPEDAPEDEYIDAWMTWAANDPDWEEHFSPYIPDLRAQAVRSLGRDRVDNRPENYALLQRRAFRRSDYESIDQPTLWVWSDERGRASVLGYHQLTELLPHMETAYAPGTTHGLQLQDPRGVAEIVARFVERHPMD